MMSNIKFNRKEIFNMTKLNNLTVCFTGHRPQNLPFGFNEEDPRCIRMRRMLARKTEELILSQGATHFISGMAIGVDIICAEIVLELREKYSHITLECAVPCKSQPCKWSDSMKERYYSILERSNKVTFVQDSYTSDCMHKRNRYMIEHTDVVIAVWNGNPSGTGYTVNYAKEKGRKIYLLNPDKL